MPTHRQTFEKGMASDLSPLLTQPGTYTYAHGFRLGMTGDGKGLSLTAEPKSEVISIVSSEDLSILQLVGLQALTVDGEYVLWFCGGGRSVIATATFDRTQKQMHTVIIYDDTRDPNGSRIGLTPWRKLQTRLDIESERLTRVYSNDGVLPPMALTLSYGYDDNGAFHSTGTPYPRNWSAHSFMLQPEVRWGHIRFEQLTETGSLLSGHYRYTYRYRSPSVESAIFPVSTPIFIRQSQDEKDLTKPVQMESSGVVTKMAMVVQVSNPDARWLEIELLVSYSPDGIAWSDLVIGDRKAIPATGPVLLTHDRHSGTGRSVSQERIATVNQTISRAAIMGMSKHKLLFGDISISIPLEPSPMKVSIKPLVSSMPLDEIGFPTLGPQGRFPLAFTYQQSDADPPLRDQQYVNSVGVGVVVDKPIGRDWRDSKGVQVAHSRVGYRRGGEHYPVAILFFDMSGQPGFAWPLGVFVTPNAFDTTDNGVTFPYAPTRQITNNSGGVQYVTQPLGMKIDNLTIPRRYIVDSMGKQIVSGFAIVRGQPSGRIGAQGIALPAVWEFGGRDHAVMAEPAISNFFDDIPDVDGFRLFVDQPLPTPGLKYGTFYRHLTGWVTLHSPELSVVPSLATKPDKGTVIRLVGSVHGVSPAQQTIIETGDSRHFYVKAYRYNGKNTLSFRPNARSRPSVNDTLAITGAWPFPDNSTLEKFYEKDQALVLHAGVLSVRGLAHQAKEAYLLKVDGNSLIDRGESESQPAGYALVNVERNVDALPEENIRYQWTGHYQPLNASVMDDVPTGIENNEPVLIFNGIHVWGGNTHLSMVDMARMIPFYNHTEFDLNFQGGYGMGLFIPIESEYNLSLRYGRTYRHVATMPQLDGTGGGTGFRTGINIFQTEDWNINEGLKAQADRIQSFAKLPPDIILENNWPQGIVWSKLKTDGQRVDAMRIIPASNLFLMEGEGGRVTGLPELFGEVYVGQTSQISRLRLNERQVMTDASGQPLLIGTTSGLEVSGSDVLNQTTGWSRPEHFVLSGRAFYWLDVTTSKFWRFSQAGVECLSDRGGFHDQLLGKSFDGLRFIFNEQDELLHIMTDTWHLTYNEMAPINAAVSWHRAWGGFAWATKKGSITQSRSDSIRTIGRALLDTMSLSWIQSPGQSPSQFFDDIQIEFKKPWLLSLKVRSSVGTLTNLTPSVDNRFRYKDGELFGPLRERTQKERLSGNWIKVEVELSHDAEPSLLLSDVSHRPLYRQ